MKKKWYEYPNIALDTIYWKPKSEIWVWVPVFIFVVHLLENLFIPAREDVKEHIYQIFLVLFISCYIALYIYGLINFEFRKKIYHKAQFTSVCGLVLLVWDLLTAKSAVLPIPYFPSAAGIFYSIYDDRNLLVQSALYSMRLFFTGMITGTILGIASGVFIGWRRQCDYWISPIIRISGIIPAVAWLPIALFIFPNSFTTGLFLIFMSSWFPVSSMAAMGIRSTPKSFFEAAKTLGAKNNFILFHVALPNAMPAIFNGIMTAAAFSFTTLIVSEMVGAKAGLGFYINWAKGWGNYSKVYGAIIIMAVEFAVILAFITGIRNSVLRWQKGIIK
ncbi:MAG: ABC transporter permease subunit [Spirochaetaceae bacterium]|jgi:NitT/TauT family transport system permease protein|nr:ABC transporter permease subunit [Spirochaetaceae bacterium]